MYIYAYNNLNNSTGQIDTKNVPFGRFIGKPFKEIFYAPQKTTNFNIEKSEEGENELLKVVSEDDVVITSTLTNFSLDFINALNTVACFDDLGVRVIAFQEEFDSARMLEKVLLFALPMMQKFRRNAFKARQEKRMEGISRASAEGKYKGRQSYNPNDFPNFRELYESYMYREIGKGEFAEKLGVSRPTLDKLIEAYTEKR